MLELHGQGPWPVRLEEVSPDRKPPHPPYRVSLYLSDWEAEMKFQVGRFTCEVLLGEGGKMRVKWLPGPPKYLNKAERDQYNAGVAKFLERLKPKDPYKGLVGIDQRGLSNLPRLNGSG